MKKGADALRSGRFAQAGGVTLAVLLLTVSSVGAQIWEPRSASELTAALETARKGDEIHLLNIVYTGHFTITTSLLLTGVDGAIVSGGGSGRVLTVSAPGATIAGLKIRNSGTDVDREDACIWLEETAAAAKIVNNSLQGCLWGIWDNRTTASRIEKNKIIGNSEAQISDRGNGIHLFATRNTQVRNNTIEYGRDGVYISNSHGVFIGNNNLRNTRFGIHYMYSHGCTVSHNQVAFSKIGAAVMYSKNLIIDGNRLSNNSEHGLLLRDVIDSRIAHNQIVENGNGLYLGSSYGNEVSGNQIVRNRLAVHVSNGSSRNRVVDNNFIDNRMQALFLDAKALTWGELGHGNFWSQYQGWDRDRDGTGDAPYRVTRIDDTLMLTYPVLSVLQGSPAMVLLQKIENQFPFLHDSVLLDQYPRMRPVPLS